MAHHSRIVGGSFNKQRNLHRRLVLGSLKISRSLYLPASHIFSPDDLNTLLSEGFILKTAASTGIVAEYTFQGQQKGKETLIA